jgi:dipeptidyl aminopeptidase/acylaminoacyl peptidase
MFTEPNSTLLFGSPDNEVALAVGKQKFDVHNPPGFIGQGTSPLPALSPKADKVAWGVALPDVTGDENCRNSLVVCPMADTPKRKSVMALYSIRNKSWKLYGDFCPGGVGSATFSADGTKVAFSAKSRSGNPDCDSNPDKLQILDLATGKLTPITYSDEVMHNARLSWSPDGKYLVGQLGAWVELNKRIVVIDVLSGIGRIIAEGTNPSWSPKGDWIAYTDSSGEKCVLIHPDGTGSKMVRNLSKGSFSYKIFFYGVVWSPDGNKLLFNEAYGALESSLDVAMLDLATGKVTIRSKHGPAVFGWSHNPSE